MPEELREAKVVGLIDPQTNSWDPHILSDLFEPEDVARISRIPVSPDYEDSWYWYKDQMGMYYVKSAYRQIVGDYEHNPGAFDKWITLWKLKVPSKWKIFLWRALCDILHTTNNLIIKRVEVDPTCPMCGLSHEDVMHTLVSCDYSKLEWNISDLPVTNIVALSFPIWLMGAMTNLTEEQFGMVVTVLYHLWSARNDAVWRGALARPAGMWRRSTAAMAAYARRTTEARTAVYRRWHKCHKAGHVAISMGDTARTRATQHTV
ncbi:PREDICTED: uncharacterized protein LOC109147757 [Ipomoea nil]|uniref:uncharacterized protein LOC109147757 n=1 Tax=Ipomoea nil TaxID=35883 RepID=UPI000901B0AC|nr:PREDICTED: uncharacterized protein LOC109147757 [Ipomoea nil]